MGEIAGLLQQRRNMGKHHPVLMGWPQSVLQPLLVVRKKQVLEQPPP